MIKDELTENALEIWAKASIDAMSDEESDEDSDTLLRRLPRWKEVLTKLIQCFPKVAKKRRLVGPPSEREPNQDLS